MTPAEFHELAVERMAEEIYETQRQDHDGAPWALLSNKSYEKTRIRHDAMAALAAAPDLLAGEGKRDEEAAP